MSETPQEYLARKAAKGTLAEPKPWLWRGRQVLTGLCPCPDCDHQGEAMILCDPDFYDCQCCSEVCS